MTGSFSLGKVFNCDGLHTQPQVEKLEAMLHQHGTSRKARFEHFEKLGLERVRADLMYTRGLQVVGGPQEVQELAWEWVQMKDAQKNAATAATTRATSGLPLVAESRLDELRKLASADFDFTKLIHLCEELNIASREECHFATAILARGLLDHVPPIFGKRNFDEVASNYGGKSFKGTMQHLQNASRNVADGHLHQQIRRSETLPTAQQVNCGQQLDALLEEIIRLTREKAATA